MSKNVDYKRIILSVIATAGILTVVAVAPNAIQVLGPFLRKKKKYNLEYYLNKKVKQLVKNGFLKISSEKGKQFLLLTEKGDKQLLYYQTKEKKKPKRWDGKWRVVIFDVWESNRVKRNMLRQEIKDFGFIQLQRSVWIYPYDCAEFIELLKADLGFGKNIRYIVVESLDHDDKLKRYFNLV